LRAGDSPLLGGFAEHEAARTRLERSDGELNAMWSLLQGGQEIFAPACGVPHLLLWPIVHHRGQLVALRLNDIPVPAMYGPTADSLK
jgi:hypothetical protein